MTPDEFKAAHAILRSRGYIDKDIARMLGISPKRVEQTFSDWRTGKVAPSPPIALLLEGYAYRGWTLPQEGEGGRRTMTTQAEAICELIANIEAGEKWAGYIAAKAVGIRADNRYSNISKAYSGSLDAAMALHDALLPKDTGFIVECSGICRVLCLHGEYEAYSGVLARAWLLAILKAYLAGIEQGLDPTTNPR